MVRGAAGTGKTLIAHLKIKNNSHAMVRGTAGTGKTLIANLKIKNNSQVNIPDFLQVF